MSLDDRIEKLRLEYTDQYVMIDADLPQYARFKNVVGRVKTINYAGRALVQFDCDDNAGRYDIELDYLKVVDKPEPKPKPVPAAKKKPPAKPKPKKPEPPKPEEMELSPLELARQAKDAESKKKEPKKETR